MIFEFAKATEVTELAHKCNPDYKTSGVIRVFLCLDVWDIWVYRIYENRNIDFETEEGKYLLERDRVGKENKSDKLSIFRAKRILENDSFEVWDSEESYDIEELIEMVDGGFGINNLTE